MLRRRHFVVGSPRPRYDDCVLCQGQNEETLDHLFFECYFSTRCWDTLGIHWSTGIDRFEWMPSAKNYWAGPMFMDLFVVAAWSFWKERKGFIFKNISPSHASWLKRSKEDFGMIKHRAKPELGGFISTLVRGLPLVAP
ncbi:glycerophosphoryl diester phosphodiesterase 1 [Hordeum vulgare]|nr:glycerophosphoryl diester phosphodiesterase 1 [Hordeum vulgare]